MMDIASKSQAENGNDNNTLMTPLRVKQSIKANAITPGSVLDYSVLENKPKINNVELSGNKSSNELGIKENVQADWNTVDNTDGSFIKNKPTIPTKTSDLNNDSNFATEQYVDDAITNLPEPMIFKGSLGTGGTISSLPAASSSNEGYTYKVITAGTYAGQAAKVGDTFISDGSSWVLIPSGDEPSGTVTSVTLKATSPINIDSTSAITTSGTRTISHANSGVTAGTYKSVTVSATGHVTAGSNPTTLSGYGITDAKIANGTITLGSNTITPLTSYTETDPVYSASAASGITSTDITNWNNKSNFSGNYNDLTNKPTIPTVNNATLTIQKNGTNVKTFTANASSDVTANITVPTKTSELTNDSGYITSGSLNNYVTLNTAQSISGEKTFTGDYLTAEIGDANTLSSYLDITDDTIQLYSQDLVNDTASAITLNSTGELEIRGQDVKITGLSNPTNNYDAATKKYVDNLIEPLDERVNGEATIELTNASSYSVDNTLDMPFKDVTQLLGDTTQETTTGKNLFISSTASTTTSGMTFTKNSDGSWTLNGTNNSGSTYFFRLNDNFTLSAGTYTLSNSNSNVSNSTAIFYDDGNNFTSRENIVTKTFSSSVTIKPYIKWNAGVTLNNFKIYPMIESGSNYTGFEKYTGTQPSPNPNYPQEAVNVTGRQEVKCVGKNLIGAFNTGSSTIKGVTITCNSNGSITFSGTSTGYIYGYINNKTGIIDTENATDSVSVITPPNSTVTLSGSGTNIKLRIRNITDRANDSSGDITKTYTSSKQLAVMFYIQTSVTINETIYPQLEYGSTATTYEPYIEQVNEINLGKNLYNANDTTYYYSCTYVSGINTDQYKIKATGTDIIINAQVASGSSYSSSAGTLIPCKYGETIYYDIGNSNFDKNFITQYNSSKVSLGFTALNTGYSSGSYTPTNSNCEYISIRIGYGSATSGTEYTLAPIISKSSNVTYAPYFEPIELCKIGTYEDKIFKNVSGDTDYSSEREDGAWYVKKNIGKLILDGSETYNNQNGEYDTATRMMFSYGTSISPDLASRKGVCNYFVNHPSTVQNANVDVTAFNFHQLAQYSRYLYFKIDKSVLPTQDATGFKNWVANHNLIIYYQMATPTYEKLNDTLQEELNTLQNTSLIKGHTNIMVDGDLPAIIDFIVYLDNLEGKYESLKSMFQKIINMIESG